MLSFILKKRYLFLLTAVIKAPMVEEIAMNVDNFCLQTIQTIEKLCSLRVKTHSEISDASISFAQMNRDIITEPQMGYSADLVTTDLLKDQQQMLGGVISDDDTNSVRGDSYRFTIDEMANLFAELLSAADDKKALVKMSDDSGSDLYKTTSGGSDLYKTTSGGAVSDYDPAAQTNQSADLLKAPAQTNQSADLLKTPAQMDSQQKGLHLLELSKSETNEDERFLIAKERKEVQSILENTQEHGAAAQSDKPASSIAADPSSPANSEHQSHRIAAIMSPAPSVALDVSSEVKKTSNASERFALAMRLEEESKLTPLMLGAKKAQEAVEQFLKQFGDETAGQREALGDRKYHRTEAQLANYEKSVVKKIDELYQTVQKEDIYESLKKDMDFKNEYYGYLYSLHTNSGLVTSMSRVLMRKNYMLSVKDQMEKCYHTSLETKYDIKKPLLMSFAGAAVISWVTPFALEAFKARGYIPEGSFLDRMTFTGRKPNKK